LTKLIATSTTQCRRCIEITWLATFQGARDAYSASTSLIAAKDHVACFLEESERDPFLLGATKKSLVAFILSEG
jgi:hypothetical protein